MNEKIEQALARVASELNAELGVDKRFYIDERVGCIAVRDKTKKDEWRSGLSQEDDDVMAFWRGDKVYNDSGMEEWRVYDWQKVKAKQLCDELNA